MKRDLGYSISSPIAIRSKRSLLVKWLCLTLALTTLALSAPSWADESQSDEELPTISAITFPVTIERRSSSGHVYLLSTTGEIPETGRLILLKKDSAPVMAFRILRQYGGKKQFAAKWMRRYNSIKQLDPAQTYMALEKLSDNSGAIPLTNQDKKDLSELEKPAPAEPAVEPSPSPSASAPSAPPISEVAPLPGPEALTAPPPPPEASPPPAVSDNAVPPPPESGTTTPPAEVPPPLPTEAPVAEASEAPPPAPEAAMDENLPKPSAEEGLPKPAAPIPRPEGYDSELDSGTSPPPKAVAETIAEAKDPEADDLSAVMVEEKPLPPHDMNFLGLGAGVYLNYNVQNGASTSFYTPGGFLLYSRILTQSIYFKGGKGLSDNLALDGWMGYYKILTLVPNSGDSYAVIPFKGDARYTIMFTDDFGVFAYGGIEQNVVVATTNPTSSIVSGLNSFFPAVGVGAIFRAGPSWYVRFDGGYESVGLSLAIRF
jgi:hypothetical protein